ncbi:MAG: O-antigen ligase family protein [Limisphaerales bacterium]|jgi:hypothetical protein|nr:O-antigen ligase family protein [Verrucomicrobiota bacterium]
MSLKAIPQHPLARKLGIATEGLFLFLVLFGPWAFGTTQEWAIRLLCHGSLLFFAMALALYFLDRHFSSRYFSQEQSRHKERLWGWADWLFIGLGILSLLYVALQWFNAQSDYYATTYEFIDYPHWEWLPSSFDKRFTLFYLFKYTALFFTYLGARILFQSGRARGRMFTLRMERFLWVVLASTFVMVIVGAFMRLDKTTTLLWMVERSRWAGINNSFGPYGYRSSAAQYMNLLWPLGIAFWWSLSSALESRVFPRFRAYLNRYLVIVVLSLFVLAGVWIAISRGGVWIASIVSVLLLALICLDALRGKHKRIYSALIILLLLAGAAGLGLQVAGQDARRLLETESSGRLEQYEASWPIYHDYPTYGVGAGAYYCMYDLYRSDTSRAKDPDFTFPFAHSDWLQLFIEFGNVGTALVVALLLWGLLLPWVTGRGTWFIRLAMILAFSTALLHAIVDLPFYIFSVSWLFVVLMAFYHALGPVGRKLADAPERSGSRKLRRREVTRHASS